MNPVLDRFREFYTSLNRESLRQLGQVYSDDILFQDPIHRVEGLANLDRYFLEMIRELKHCDFDIEDITEADGEAYVRWIMHFAHPRLKRGATISVPGVSHIKFHDKLYYHRDYFDAGAMLYEHIPLLGSVIGSIKKRLKN